MIVSHNELVATVNKAFLGMQKNCGEADVVANMVADLQMVGLNGVEHFNSASHFLSSEQDCPVDINNVNAAHLNVDLHRCSLACHLPVIMDYALEKMIGQKKLMITLDNCHNRWLAYSELVKLAAKGIACRAKWENGADSRRTLYVLNRGCIAPELYFSETTGSVTQDVHSMVIELSLDDFCLQSSSQGYSTHINGRDLQLALTKAWSNGIFVEDTQWSQLKQTAMVFLVESSERSLEGAGGAI